MNKQEISNTKPIYSLRWYQQEAVDAFWSYIYDKVASELANPLLVLPTGTGKSIIIAKIINDCVQKFGNKARVIMLTHNSELVKQNFEKIKTLLPASDVGICSNSLKSKSIHNQIVCGTIQTVVSIFKKAEKSNTLGLFKPFNLIIIDEAHLVSDIANSQYRTTISILKKLNNKTRVLGLTATPYRLKGGVLTLQEPRLFTEIIYNLNDNFQRLIKEGFLSNLLTYKTNSSINTDKIHTIGGDFNQKELEKEISKEGFLEDAISQSIQIAKDENRKHWICFIAGIANSEKVSALLNSQGIKAVAVNSSHKKEFNDKAISDFKNQSITCLVSADKLTTGFDAPLIDMIIFLRPTQSKALYVQSLGRGTRPAEGKKDCLVLDFARNIERHGPINRISLSPTDNKKNDENEIDSDLGVKCCPKCHFYYDSKEDCCPYCGFIKPKKEKKENTYILSTDIDVIVPDLPAGITSNNLLLKTLDVGLMKCIYEYDYEKNPLFVIVFQGKLDTKNYSVKIKLPLSAKQLFKFNKYYKFEKSMVIFKHLSNVDWCMSNEFAEQVKTNQLNLKKPSYLQIIPRNWFQGLVTSEIENMFFFNREKEQFEKLTLGIK